MTEKERSLAVVKNAVRILSIECAFPENELIDLLTGYLWDEEESSNLKESEGVFLILERKA